MSTSTPGACRPLAARFAVEIVEPGLAAMGGQHDEWSCGRAAGAVGATPAPAGARLTAAELASGTRMSPRKTVSAQGRAGAQIASR
jgi:hypothetical protein